LWDLGDDVTFNTKSFEVFYDELGSYPAQLILTDECVGTIDTFVKDIQITLRQAVEAFGDTTICEEQSFTLGATDVEEADFFWQGPNDFVSDEQFPSVLEATENMSGQYAVIGIVFGCATFPSFADVEILPLPEPDFNQDSIYCNRRDDVVLYPGKYENYVWQDGGNSPEHTISREGLYAVTVTGANGCDESISIQMSQRCPTELFVPNIFSPNDDGFNDVWKVYGHDITSFDLEVKNRWGEIIFVSQDEEQSWDGEVHGSPAVPDVYMYTVIVEGYTEEGEPYKETLTGSMTLVR
jgi:gliding motility-associated-like protein